jgi:hydroxyacylglutathione hydrolase
MLDVTILPILNDNYAYILHSKDEVAVLDPGDAAPIIKYLEQHNWVPNYIFNTHHHGDHVAGNNEIKQKYNCRVVGPAEEKDKIKTLDVGLSHGEFFNFGGETIQVIKTAGHTNGHISFYFQSSNTLFCGDALFAMGCGRLFEGTPKDMFKGFQHIKRLPLDCKIYCGHEYTLTNAKFCLSIEPDNTDLIQRYKEVENLRRQKQPTIPTTLEQELKTNLFLMAETADALGKIRALKDRA